LYDGTVAGFSDIGLMATGKHAKVRCVVEVAENVESSLKQRVAHVSTHTYARTHIHTPSHAHTRAHAHMGMLTLCSHARTQLRHHVKIYIWIAMVSPLDENTLNMSLRGA